jgi:Zn ribbon nucleic-acid-binding protein
VEIDARQVECLGCGYRRVVGSFQHHLALDECPKCGYVGWASTAELTEPMRRLLRERPLAGRRLRILPS